MGNLTKINKVTEANLLIVRATNSAGTSIPNSTTTYVPFNGETFDPYGAFDPTTGTLTIPVGSGLAGKYLVLFRFHFESSAWTVGKQVEIGIRKNGAEFAQKKMTIQASITLPVENNIMDTVDVVEGDAIRVSLFQDSGGAKLLNALASHNSISIFRVGL